MKYVDVDQREGVALVTLNRGVTNALNLEFVAELGDTVRDLKDDPDTRALVLRGSNDKFFAIGWDLPELLTLTRDDFVLFFRTFCRMCVDLYTLPKPTVAAITGHATAGGCIVALCCDYRFIAEGRKLMGLNEIKLGVPIPYPADCILRALAGDRIAREIVEMGAFHGPEQMERFGLVDEVLPLEQVLPDSIERAAALGAHPVQAFGRIKQDRVERTQARINAHLDEKEKIFLECWFSDETRERLEKAAEKF